MQFDRKKRLRLTDDGLNSNPYPFWINFYTMPPEYKVSLQEIEDMATERLKILKIIDDLMKQSEQVKGKPMEFYEILISQINSIKCSSDYKNFYTNGRSESCPKVYEARKRDHISHFLLRIYYCQTENLRRWFISREVELFKARYIDSSSSNLTSLVECLSYYGFNYEIISIADNPELSSKINFREYKKTNTSIAFKLKFEDAIDLVRSRRVYLSEGYAYIGSNEIMSVLCNVFRSNLSLALNKMHINFECFDDPRLLIRLDLLHKTYIANNAKKTEQNGDSKERIDPEKIDELCKELFPPCMRSIHETLRKEHHLKHYGRLYYGLFLKSIGMTLEDAVEFFRSELSINNPEKFQKEYSYTIRYIYGKEGKRVQLSPYSCQKIINGNAPGPNDTHGCPFRHYDINNLKATLIRYGVNDENDLNAIVNMVTNDKNYTGACTKYFSVKYQREMPETFKIYHPNQFYNEARRVLYSPKPILEKPIEKNDGEDGGGGDPQNCDDQGNDTDYLMDDTLDELFEEELLSKSLKNDEQTDPKVIEKENVECDKAD